MKSKIRKYILDKKTDKRLNSMKFNFNLKLNLLNSNQINSDNYNIKNYDYLINFKNQDKIKNKLIKWENKNYSINRIDEYISNFKSSNLIKIYKGIFFISKIIYYNNELIKYCYENDVVSYFFKNINNNEEPELQYLILKSLFNMIINEQFIIFFLLKNNYIINLIKIFKIEVFKIKKIIILLFINIFENIKYFNKDNKYDNQNISNFKEFFYEIEKLINNEDFNSEIFEYLTLFILVLIKNHKLEENDKYAILINLKILYINNNNLEVLKNLNKIINKLINNKNILIFNDKIFFEKIFNFIKYNINSEYDLYKSWILLLKFTKHDNLFSNIIIKNGFQNYILQILNFKIKKINEIIFKICSNILCCSREEFLIFIKIPFLYQYLVKLLDEEKDKKLLLEIFYIFCNFSKYLKIENNSINLEEYIIIVFNFFKNEFSSDFILLGLEALKYILELFKMDSINKENQIINYLFENNLINNLFNLKSNTDKDVVNKVNKILDIYLN